VERRNHVSSNSDFWYAQIDLFGAKLTASGQTAAGTHNGGYLKSFLDNAW
jgi:hypothetical protein